MSYDWKHQCQEQPSPTGPSSLAAPALERSVQLGPKAGLFEKTSVSLGSPTLAGQ
jgi:hypothetical protein